MTQADPQSHPTVLILGNSPAICAIRDKIVHLASFDSIGGSHVPTTLVVGETGTGKGLVARAIHEGGPRAHGPLIDVNCAAIPENLLEAELFGYEAGAFTDAKRAKLGLFEAASKGTLFLDEVDALTIQLQAKLLKAIEEKRIRRLGAVSDRSVDVKIVAATQRDLNSLVSQRRFRADLFHRLAVVVLELPPLRARGEDILLLANHISLTSPKSTDRRRDN
jgi:two-component system, NtrC family, response regulator AtoC